MSVPEKSDVILTVDDVRQWRHERDSVSDEITKLTERRDDLNRRLAIVTSFMTPSAHAAVFGESAEPAPQDMTAWLRDIVLKADGPLSYRNLIQLARGTPFEERLNRNTNTLYNAVARMAERGEVERVGNGVISTSAAQRMRAAGKEILTKTKAPSNGAAVVYRVLKEHPGGLRTADVLRAMRTDPNLEATLNRNPQYGYTVLSRLTKRGLLTRANGRYALVADSDLTADREGEDAESAENVSD